MSRTGAVVKFVGIDLVGSVVWFPVWWYTKGLQRVVMASVRALQFRIREYGFGIWIRNFFVPMYGQYDFAGRLISVLVRFAVLIGRLVALGVEAAFYGLGMIAWTLAPIAFALLALSSIAIR